MPAQSAGFSESLRQLQALHEQEVSTLATEVAQLRAELELLRKRSQLSEEDVVVGPPSVQDKGKGLNHLPLKGDGSLLDDSVQVTAKLRMRSHGCRYYLSRLVSRPSFDFVMGIIIVANAATIAVEATVTRAGGARPMALQVLEYVFLVVYIVELGLRLAALGCRALCSGWVQFDLFLVCCGCLDVVAGLAVKSFSNSSIAVLDQVLLVRIFRLARLARVLRLMIKFQTLWILVQGLVNSLVTLVWTCIIICILLFVFAVLGMEVIRPDPAAGKEYNDIATQHFGSLFRAMVTLAQGLTLDSFGAIYWPVMLERPLTVFYFVPFLLVVSIALMNLVTALMVNFSLEQANRDKQLHEQVIAEQKSQTIRTLEQAFRDLDTNNSGQIDLQEMLEAPEDLRSLIFDVADMEDEHDSSLATIFATLDFDQSGSLEIREFCEGLLKLHDKTALDSYFIMRHCTNIMNMLKRSHEEPVQRAGTLAYPSQGSVPLHV